MAEKFFSSTTIAPNCYLEPIKTSYDEDKGLISFVGKKEDFSSVKDFSTFLSKTIKDNDLSIIRLKKGNMLKTWVQDRFMKSEVDFYQLDKMYEKRLL